MSPQVVEPVASERAIVAIEKFLFWVEGFHVAHNHTLVCGLLKIAIVAIKILLLSFRIVLVTLAMLYVNSALNATYSFNFSLCVLCGQSQGDTPHTGHILYSHSGRVSGRGEGHI